MKQFARHQLILDTLRNGEAVEISELVDATGASSSTVRRDLRVLEDSGRIVSLRGGYVRLNDRRFELPTAAKAQVNQLEKDVIATLAAATVQNDETIYLDSGTTATLVVSHLLDKRVHVITSNTHVLTLDLPRNLTITMLGGDYAPDIGSVAGPLTDQALADLYFDRSFIGVTGVSPGAGVTTYDLGEANKKRVVQAHSRVTYALADSSKFNQVSLCSAFKLSECVVISDRYDPLLDGAGGHITPG